MKDEILGFKNIEDQGFSDRVVAALPKMEPHRFSEYLIFATSIAIGFIVIWGVDWKTPTLSYSIPVYAGLIFLAASVIIPIAFEEIILE